MVAGSGGVHPSATSSKDAAMSSAQTSVGHLSMVEVAGMPVLKDCVMSILLQGLVLPREPNSVSLEGSGDWREQCESGEFEEYCDD